MIPAPPPAPGNSRRARGPQPGRPALSRRLVPSLLVALASSCGPSRAAVEAPLLPPAAFGADFMLVQSLEVEQGESRLRLQAVLQKRGATVTLLGLTPMGTRAFVIEQHGEQVISSSYLPEGRELPFPPELVLGDVQRALLPQLAGGSPLPDGVHRRSISGADATERWQAGRLVERTISTGRQAITTISYEPGMRPGEPPDRIVLASERPPYRLALSTLSFQRL